MLIDEMCRFVEENQFAENEGATVQSRTEQDEASMNFNQMMKVP